MNKTICFYDFEATSVSKDAQPISLGIIAVQNKSVKTIYCEFTDFNIDLCDNWVKENVVGKLKFKGNHCGQGNNGNIEYSDKTSNISQFLKQWLSQFENPCFVADFDVVDKPMLIDLIADWDTSNNEEYLIDINTIPSNLNVEDFVKNWKKYSIITTAITPQITKNYKIGLPKHLPNIRYDQFFDLHTVFWLKGIDPDCSRELFSDIDYYETLPESLKELDKHNPIWDAHVSYLCYEKLMRM